MARQLKQEEIDQARKDFRKTIEDLKEQSLPPDLHNLMQWISAVANDEEAKDSLREEIIRHYGE